MGGIRWFGFGLVGIEKRLFVCACGVCLLGYLWR